MKKEYTAKQLDRNEGRSVRSEARLYGKSSGGEGEGAEGFSAWPGGVVLSGAVVV